VRSVPPQRFERLVSIVALEYTEKSHHAPQDSCPTDPQRSPHRTVCAAGFVMTRLLAGASPAKNLTFRATAEQRAAYERAAAATGARTLSDAITKVLDAWAAKVELNLDWECLSHPPHQSCQQCAPAPRHRKRDKNGQ
jgi:hypothetical protein